MQTEPYDFNFSINMQSLFPTLGSLWQGFDFSNKVKPEKNHILTIQACSKRKRNSFIVSGRSHVYSLHPKL